MFDLTHNFHLNLVGYSVGSSWHVAKGQLTVRQGLSFCQNTTIKELIVMNVAQQQTSFVFPNILYAVFMQVA